MRAAFASLLALRVVSAFAGEGPYAKFTDPILRNERLPAGHYGVEVRELASGKLLFADGADHLLNPASGIKVLTAAAALSALGPNHRFRTTLRRSGTDLCLVGGGDPSLVNETVGLLAEEARRKGASRIEGDLIADDSFFPAARDHLLEFEGDGERSFTAPVGALSVNFNSVTIHAEPTELGSPPRLFLDPDLPSFLLTNRARTAERAVKGDLSASVEEHQGSFRVVLGGKVARGRERTTIYRAVPDPALYAASLFAEQLRRAGGSIAGRIRTGRCPAAATLLLEFPSKPLSQVVFDMNKFSNNFIAEMLLRAVGDLPTPESGRAQLAAWLRDRGIPPDGTVLDNASGLSRKTRISARTLAAVVRNAANDLTIGPEFLASLGIAGTDGTLHRRFAGTAAEGNVRAKSGSLAGVVSLTGVLRTTAGENLVFSTLFNLPSRPNGDLQRLEERLILAWTTSKSR